MHRMTTLLIFYRHSPLQEEHVVIHANSNIAGATGLIEWSPHHDWCNNQELHMCIDRIHIWKDVHVVGRWGDVLGQKFTSVSIRQIALR